MEQNRNFRKFLTVTMEFPFCLIFLPEFLEFWVEWFAFRKLNNFRIFWKLSQEISVPFVSVSKLSKVLVEWKALSVCCVLGQGTLRTPPFTEKYKRLSVNR